MGGHAFKGLQCPRISPDVYTKVKSTATVALRTVFAHVEVPLEVPGKVDFGDVDFLVSAPIGQSTDLSLATFPFPAVIEATKGALDTSHGRRGFLTPDCMYFAVPLPATTPEPCVEDESSDKAHETWVQIDVKVCFKPEMFDWMTFELNFASQSSILGSMIKPLGLTLDPKGLHVRVEEMEATDWAGSMVWITKDPWMVCRLLGLGRRAVDGGFESSEQSKSGLPKQNKETLTQVVYEEYAGSWLFHPENFRAKLEDDSYLVQHNHRAQFLKKWIPVHYSNYKLNAQSGEDIASWIARTRHVVRETVFTRFPKAATEYYCKRLQYVKEAEERRLRELITAAIPAGSDGWSDEFGLPPIVVEQAALQYAPGTVELTRPPSLVNKPIDLNPALSEVVPRSDPHGIPVHIDALPRQPPYSCKAGPPPLSMSASARLACLARWTVFSATGVPYLLTTPHAKEFDLQWRDAIEAGFSEERLVKWAQEIWWLVWVRQCVVNWRGMWAKRFEKDDVKAEKARKAEEKELEEERVEKDAQIKADELVQAHKQKVMKRLERMNRALGLTGADKQEHST